ncbi:MAG: hypothetical protein IKF37_00630 [Bacilli bacterium]|nr:hypothetical protein [Bacilli bacterium]
MKNTTSFTDKEIQGIIEKMEVECPDCSLTERQVLNIAAIVDNFKYESNEDKLLALEYTSMIRNQIMFYLNHVVKPNKRVDYIHKQYLTIEAITKRVIMALYPDRKFDLYEIDDKQIELNTLMMLKDLEIEKRSRNSIKKKALIKSKK